MRIIPHVTCIGHGVATTKLNPRRRFLAGTLLPVLALCHLVALLPYCVVPGTPSGRE
jgi:hypothetical protein